MATISSHEIVTENHEERYRLLTEWQESSFKIMLLKLKNKPLIGEMEAKDVTTFSEELEKSNAQYIQETKEAFTGKNTEIKFFISKNVFEWWQGNMWLLGRIQLHTISDTDILSETLQNVLRTFEDIQLRLEILEEQNKSLVDIKTKLTFSIEEMIKIKDTLERNLYSKFLLVLNEKKKKIRELKKKIDDELGKKSIFNVSTDESSHSEGEPEISTLLSEKRKLNNVEDCSEESKSPKSRKLNLNAQECLTTSESNPQPTTSKTCENEEHNDSQNESKSTVSETNSSPESLKLHFSEEESDEDMFE